MPRLPQLRQHQRLQLTRTRPLLALVGVALLGCGGGDDGDRERAADDYAVAVEGATDAVRATVEDAVVVLNEVADRPEGAAAGAEALDGFATNVRDAGDDVAGLAPPAGAEGVADDLAFAIGDLARLLGDVATDLRGAAGEPGTVPDLAAAGGRGVLASGSGVSALSRALRALVDALAA